MGTKVGLENPTIVASFQSARFSGSQLRNMKKIGSLHIVEDVDLSVSNYAFEIAFFFFFSV